MANEARKGKEFEGIVQQLPPFRERVALLQKTINVKEQKIAAYGKQAAAIDLVVCDLSSLFSFSDFSKFFPAFAYAIGKTGILNSSFREIFVLIRRINGKTLGLPLKLNIFVGEVIALESLIKRSRFIKTREGRALLYLVAALAEAGFVSVRAGIEERTFFLCSGPWILRYHRGQKSIGDTLVNWSRELGEPVAEAVSIAKDLSAQERAYVRRLIQRRKKVAAAAPLFFEVNVR